MFKFLGFTLIEVLESFNPTIGNYKWKIKKWSDFQGFQWSSVPKS